MPAGGQNADQQRWQLHARVLHGADRTASPETKTRTTAVRGEPGEGQGRCLDRRGQGALWHRSTEMRLRLGAGRSLIGMIGPMALSPKRRPPFGAAFLAISQTAKNGGCSGKASTQRSAYGRRGSRACTRQAEPRRRGIARPGSLATGAPGSSRGNTSTEASL